MQFLGLEISHYRLTQRIGSGGMGEVYLAEDLHLSRQIAIKLLRMDLLTTTDTHNLQTMLHLFQREAQAISRLSHPHILPLYEYNEQDVQGTRISYMVMPFCSQGSLEQWLLRRRHPLTLPLAEALLLCVKQRTRYNMHMTTIFFIMISNPRISCSQSRVPPPTLISCSPTLVRRQS